MKKPLHNNHNKSTGEKNYMRHLWLMIYGVHWVNQWVIK